MGDVSERGLTAFAARLGVSAPTLRNWRRTGVVEPPGDTGLWSEVEQRRIIRRLMRSGRLTSGANRLLLTRRAGATRALPSARADGGALLPEALTALLATRLLADSGLLWTGWRQNPRTRIERSLREWWSKFALNDTDAELLAELDLTEYASDPLGGFHQAQQSEGRRARSGIYYTPFAPVGAEETIPPGNRVCDPCCGSGALLWRYISPETDSADIYAFDIDETALRICEVNAALFFRDPDHRVTLRRRNHLTPRPRLVPEAPFDWIVTNPPWGVRCGMRNGGDSFELAVTNSLKLLGDRGEFRVLLPGAFLNVDRHTRLRRRLLERGAVRIHRQSGSFPGVMSNPVLVESSPGACGSVTIDNGSGTTSFAPAAPGYRYTLDAAAGTWERRILDKFDARGELTLRGGASFGVGIVTGDNRRLLLPEPLPGAEPVFRGRDIHPFRIEAPGVYLRFSRRSFQQCAPEESLRREKIIYRFIARRPVCAIDRSGVLTLNSANFFIPTLPGMPWEALAALLNSEIYAFVYMRRYPTLKILRRHLESLTFPSLDPAEAAELSGLYHECAAGAVADELNRKAAAMFGITGEELEFIISHNRVAVNGESCE